jgi:hypothetical protein
MSRGLTGTILWSLAAGAVGVALFFIKHEVKDMEHRLAGLNEEIQRNEDAIHVLRAEWSYLNDPARLRDLSERHLGMHPVMPSQVATMESLPRAAMPATGKGAGSMLAARPRIEAPRTEAPAAGAGVASADLVRPIARPVVALARTQPSTLAGNDPVMVTKGGAR